MGEIAYLPPGVDFAAELVAGLRARHADLPRVTLFVNSQRMERRVRACLDQGPASFLPRIHVLSDLGRHPVLADLPPAASRLSRLLDLSRLIDRLLVAQPDLAPRSALFDLAQSLGDLADEMQEEGVSARTLADLDVSGHSAHWARTQAFLAIVAPFIEASRARQAAERLSQSLFGPVVIAGSTGSRGANLSLMRAVAQHPLGAVVLPGFDPDLPAAVWAGMEDALSAEDHPQFRAKRFADALGLTPEAFTPWTDRAPADAGRNRLISLSLRPAPVTDQWRSDGALLPDLRPLTRNLTLIEARTPREEALAVALSIREKVALGVKVALITPDRNLARRVTAELDRWSITPDDSAGVPLALTPPGRFLRQVARAFEAPVTPDVLVGLLKHPLAGSGGARGLHLLLTREMEMELRRKGPAFPDEGFVVAWAKARPEPDAAAWGAAMGRALTLLASPAPGLLQDHLARHLAAAEALACGPGSGLWEKETGAEAAKLIATLQAETSDATLSTSDYRRLFETEIAGGSVRSAVEAHPLVTIQGPREAREVEADCLILSGLSEGVWPATPSPDPWLNRQMRKAAGLLLPERQIGLSAHDWQQAVAAPEVILTRALRDADAETVPARWLNRLSNLMAGLPDRHGPEALRAMKARGQAWLTRAARLEAPEAPVAPEPRPAPAPPPQHRPKRLSLTRISTLIRDPYAIYAQYILRLKPLDSLRPEPDPRDRGNAIHLILERFVRDRPETETRDQARARLLAISETVLAEQTPFPSARLLWLSRMERAADHFLNQDQKHGGQTIQVEARGEVVVDDTGFILFGTPDRVDVLPDGRLHLIDYKTGTPPSVKQQAAFDLQLHLAAAMAERGGFGDPAEVALISYIGLGSGEKALDTALTPAEIDAIWARFAKLIRAYQGETQGYAARRAIFETRFPGDYDHLSRFGEWDMTDKAQTIRLGDDPL